MTVLEKLLLCSLWVYLCCVLFAAAHNVTKALIDKYASKGINYYDYDVKGIPFFFAPFILKKIEEQILQDEEAENV